MRREGKQGRMKRLFFIGTAVFAVACQAGIKYWDNPAYKAFDVGKPDGLSITIR